MLLSVTTEGRDATNGNSLATDHTERLKLMLLIYVPKITNRIGYTLKVLFRIVLRVDFEITTDLAFFQQHDGPKLSYGPERIGDSVWVKATELLTQTTVLEHDLHIFKEGNTAAFYPSYGRDLDFSFDMIAASFFMLSRYEEYLPHRSDMHGRFTSETSIALQHDFLQTAVVERWAIMLANKIKERYPEWNLPLRGFDMVNTIDIDAAYCYKHKGLLRTLMGFGRDFFTRKNSDEVALRRKVLMHKADDPFDTFDYILDLKMKHRSIPMVFFVLLGDYSQYDKSISYHVEEFRQLLKHLGDYARLGMHASYDSFEEPQRIDIEKARLEQIVNRTIVRNRSHFLRIQLPQTYRMLLRAGIEHDYSMGYAEQPGFRAGISTPYPFFNLNSDSEMLLTIHPFMVMDATLKRYQQMGPDEAWPVVKGLMDEVDRVHGTFSCIWHNENLSEMFGWEGWRTVYEQMLDYGEMLKTK